MADRVAVYAGTENVYPQMYTSLKSLLINNKMDRVYLLIETDRFPFYLPKNVIPINVKDQTYFPKGAPNTASQYTYMELLRCALAQLFPNEKEVLWLDIDTIIDNDITDLFDLDLRGYFYAGCAEPMVCNRIFTYINVGVVLCNLELLREMNKEAEMIYFLNTYKFTWPAQDVINLLAQGRIRRIDSEYNANDWCSVITRPRIYHFAAKKVEEYTKNWVYKKYERADMPIDELE